MNQPSPAKAPALSAQRDWAHHGANHYYKGYDQRCAGCTANRTAWRTIAGKATSSPPTSTGRSLRPSITGSGTSPAGSPQWKINACEPSVQWQIFDYFLKPMVSRFFIKNACEPLHVQLNLPDRNVSVINLHVRPQPTSSCARVFDLDARLLWEESLKTNAPANAYRECFAVPEPQGATPVYFVKLELNDAHRPTHLGQLLLASATGVNRPQGAANPAAGETGAGLCRTRGAEKVARVRATNPGDRLAFFVQVA